jgi:RND family efflux transporter MFP subunit
VFVRPPSALLAALAVAFALSSCGESPASAQGRWKGRDGKGKEDADAPMPVAVTRLAPTTIERYYRASGTLTALYRAEIRAVRTGILMDLAAEEGDRVVQGQVLGRLDARELSLVAKRDKLAAVNAERELERLQSIADRNALAREELDKQRYAVETALASAKLSGHQAALTAIRAPFDGTIVSRLVDPGHLATTSTVLFEIADLSALELELYLPEREATHVALDAPVHIELVDGTQFDGRVLRRAPIVDPTTGTVKFTVRSQTFPAAAVPGSFVRARLLLESRQNVPSVPRSAIFDVEGTPHAYVVVDGKAQRVPVTPGIEGDDRMEIRGGIGSEQTVVVDASGITEGMTVTPVDEIAGEKSEG